MSTDRKTLAILAVILALAAFFRFWQLSSIPPGLYPDEAMNGNDALEALQTGDFKIFYPNNNGREGLYINILAGFIKIFGAQIWVIRLLPAVIGTLTVLGIFLLTKELFGSQVGLWSAFFLAASFWHLNFSRIGFRAIMVPFLLCFSFYFLFKGLRTLNWRDFIFGGIFFGAGFHTYIAFRFAPLILVVALLAWWLRQREGDLLNEKNEKVTFSGAPENSPCRVCYGVLIFLIATFVVAAPIGWYFLNNPQDFFGRTGQVSVFSSANPLKELALSFGKTLVQYNFAGDYNWRHNFAGSPELFWPVGLLFVVGIILIVKRRAYSVQRTDNNSDSTFNVQRSTLEKSFLLSGFFVMMLPSVLTSEGLPHALRTIGTIPFAVIFAALGLEWTLSYLGKYGVVMAKIFSGVLIIGVSYWTFQQYFYRWAKNPEVEGSFTGYFAKIGQTLNKLPPEIDKYVIVNESGVLVNGLPMPAQTPKFVAHGARNVTYLNQSETDKIKFEPETIIIPMKPDINLYQQMREKYPKLQGSYNENGVFVIKTR